MKYLFAGFFFNFLLALAVHGQHQVSIIITGDDEPLPGASVFWKEKQLVRLADTLGKVTFVDLPDGFQTFIVTFVGYKEKTFSLKLPSSSGEAIIIGLEAENEEEEEAVIVTATRTSRTISDIPTRTEVISGEELSEKANMKPGDIRMLLNESTGIQTQQTSATSYNSGIRIQGLDGRYTQILRDGYPLYSGFSGGLSLLQIAPLDLKQVEVIKGSSSTLYGGGAIAGLVNLVSKTPVDERELSFVANATTAKGLDLSGFYSERYGKVGLTVFGSRNSNAAFDPAGIGLTAIPEFERYTFNPRIFLYGQKTTADIGVSYISEKRTGGSMNYIKNGGSGFYERNNSDRLTAQFGIVHRLNENATLQLKNSYSRFDRLVAIPTYSFDALQQSSFSELTWNRKGTKADWVIGANVLTDNLREQPVANSAVRDYNYTTLGIFVQNAWTLNELFMFEAGLRADYINGLGTELLPRVALMYKISSRFTTRIGGGFGYKPPTIFTEEAERLQFQQILPVHLNSARNERSKGANWDINYTTNIGALGFTFNHLFFITRLNHPLTLIPGTSNKLQFVNSDGYIDTRGMETNLRLTYNDFKLFIGYTYTDANTYFSDKRRMPLTARSRLNNVLMYEVDEKWKIGLEAYYYSRQQLTDGTYGKPYWITGLMIEKLWEKLSIFINFENFTNTRQTRFDTIFTGSIEQPLFRDIYAPVDGFVMNGGVKIRL